MTYFHRSNTLQSLYGPKATPGSVKPIDRTPPPHVPPKYLGFGRPAQNSAGQA